MSSQSPSFLVQLVEAVSAISVPLGGGLAAYAKWRRSAERDRRAREEAARVASEKAASTARKEEQDMRDALLREKDARIESLEKLNREQAKEIASLRQLIDKLTGR